jgi:hypothetical protein
MKQVLVVIPIHTASPSNFELISFTQCFRILSNHDIIVIAPEGLDLTKYKIVVKDFRVRFINPKWQSSVLNYNKLKLSRFFYDLFSGYEFLLTYELDSFVFKDELTQWCSKPYDYIGAPWFIGHDHPTDELLGVGNSGFSLRRIGAIKKIINKMYLYGINNDQVKNGWAGTMKLVLFKLLSLRGENYSIQRFTSLFEDHFLCDVAVKKNPGFKIAPISEAMQFAFETRPEILYEMNSRQLPMGCHAWWRYNLEFWKPHIERFGYTLN